MNENPKNGTRGHTAASVAIGLLVGAAVGAGIALLLAPGTGRDTRKRLGTAGERLGYAARNNLDRVRRVARDFKDGTKPALEVGREA